MSMQDPIADLLTRIRNGHAAKKKQIKLSSSKIKSAIAAVLKDEGYVEDYMVNDVGSNKKELTINLKYYAGSPVIKKIRRISSPGLRVYQQAKSLEKVLGGLGISIVTNSQGVMSDIRARKLGLGGEVICFVE